MKHSQLRQLIREEINKTLKKEVETSTNPVDTPQQNKQQVNSSVTNILRVLNSQENSFKNIKNKEIFIQLLDGIIDKLDPEFKESNFFKQGILGFYQKYR